MNKAMTNATSDGRGMSFKMMIQHLVRIACLFLLTIAILSCAGGSTLIACDQPLIGITSVYRGTAESRRGTLSTQMTYIHAVRQAGGVALVIPPTDPHDHKAFEKYVHVLDGLVLVGGLDVPPAAYGQTPHKTVKPLPPTRFHSDSRLIQQWLVTNKPMLGICLGSQLTNVMRGGTLIQDIPSQVGQQVIHRSKEGASHAVTITSGTRLHAILKKDRLMVNSFHHQAVKKLGQSLIVAARSDDGVIEAIELPGERFVLGVQWHPEKSDDPEHRAIFNAFIAACRG